MITNFNYAKNNTDKNKNNNPDLELAFQGINKKFGEGALMRLGDATKMNVSVISTGSLAIDLSLGAGGLPRGRIVEIYGPESSEKQHSVLVSLQKPKEMAETLYLLMLNMLLIQDTQKS